MSSSPIKDSTSVLTTNLLLDEPLLKNSGETVTAGRVDSEASE
eukprot:CAMPEP_0173179382 /NCGR_PEP_ID=MMETSP1141-20130122/6079_1 /TAXON_ID=483371 /ORGANISM="non described non described, Strain CCMP2298" /LENGTH=42 /DNA_ID= /DNA_START= /DNA_END= /DNA_ORIENTATION=